MKRIILLLLVLMPIISRAQGFVVDYEAREVRWSKVYETSMSQDEIYKQILDKGILANVVKYQDIIVGDIPARHLDYKSLGYSRMNLPIYISNDRFGGRMTFRFKEGRYKAEVHSMYFVGDLGTLSAGMTPIETYIENDFKDVPRIIVSFLEKITEFALYDDEW